MKILGGISVFIACFVLALFAPKCAYGDHWRKSWWKNFCEKRGGCHKHGNRYERWRDKWKEKHGGGIKDQKGRASKFSHSAGRNFSGGGQRTGAGTTSSGFSGLGGNSGMLAKQFEQLASQVSSEQRAIAEESYTQSPGQSHPDAGEFYRRTDSGKSTYSNYSEEATHPEVKEQAAVYDDLGDIRKSAEDEAKKYRDQEKEFNNLAAKEAKNAENLGSTDPNGSGTMVPTADSAGSDNGQLAAYPGANGAAKPATASAMIGAEGLGGVARKGPSSEEGKLSDISSGKGATLATAEFSGGGVAGGGSNGLSSREALRDKLMRDKGRARVASDGEEESAPASETNASAEEKTAGSKEAEAKDAKGKPLSKELKADDLPAFGDRGLGKQQMALDGPETEASVKKMLASLSGENDPANRQLASYQDDASIGSQEGPTLFERCHATHKRCEKNGCVRLAVQSGTGG